MHFLVFSDVLSVEIRLLFLLHYSHVCSSDPMQSKESNQFKTEDLTVAGKCETIIESSEQRSS